MKPKHARPIRQIGPWIITQPDRSQNVIYLLIGLILIGVITIFLCLGVFVIRKRTNRPSESSSAVDLPTPAPVGTGNSNTLRPPPLSPVPIRAISTATKVSITATPIDTPTHPVTCSTSQGEVLDRSFNSPVAGGSVPYQIYLPPCYSQNNRRYPYVILLHGARSDETEWTVTLGVNQILDNGIAGGALPPMVLVMPFGGYLEYENLFTNGGSFESLILNDLIPAIEDNYCVMNTQMGRALAGISRGGFWVFEIGLRHPDVFGALAGHSAYFDPTIAPPDYNPLNLAQTVNFTAGRIPRLWLDVASDDGDTRPGLDAIAQSLGTRHIELHYMVYPSGGHLPTYWQSHLAEYLSFYGQGWPVNPQLLPACR